MQQDAPLLRSPGERIIICVVGLLLLVFPSCSRNRHHLRADRDTYNVLREKTCWRPWQLPGSYTVNADPRSRMFDPSDPNDPMLPHPGPHLYSYQLPQLSESWDTTSEQPEPIPLPPPSEIPSEILEPEPAESADSAGYPVRLASAVYETNGIRRLPVLDENDGGENAEDPPSSPKPYAETEEGLTIQPVPRAYWDAIPQACLSRMLEFESVREEYRSTFGSDPPETLRDPSRKLTFNNIVELAYLNSREYQTQKETLYIVAMALTLERYQYLCKFSSIGNGALVDYDHLRTNGATVDTLSTPSSLRADKMLAFGGTFVTNFANNIVLTFNGPQGFAESISSDLLYEFTQSVFQRDIVLEDLIQSERNVVYAGRNFARYRKQFFFDLAVTYYEQLLSGYRQIEINTQNYFAKLRALEQAEEEVRAAVRTAQSRVQIDQIEQGMLDGRRTLIGTCNVLETRLDRLKLTLGLPTETPINIDLRELEMLTRRDEIEVAGETIQRARERVDAQLASESPDREEILSTAVALLERILDWMQLRKQIGQEGANERELRVLRAYLRVDEAYEAVDRAQQQLAAMTQSVPPAPPVNVFQGTMNMVQARLEVVARQLQLADELAEHLDQRGVVLANYVVLRDRTDAILERVARFLQGDGNEDLKALQPDAEAILQELEGLDATTARRVIRVPETRPDARAELQQTMREVQQLLETSDRLTSDLQGLPTVDLSVDDAMVTALVQRFDLMNERGSLADNWRDIKLAADDLKSRLNLRVAQRFPVTRNNRPFAFSFDDSRTELRASLDLPLNRRQQRNGFKRSLINYQLGRRRLMALEDNIKFDVREDLRQLALDRVQYDIDVVSAALARNRVYSTQLAFALGQAEGVSARDFLEAQDTYRRELSTVANRRFGYIANRARLALDLELMMLDDTGLWPELNNEDYQPRFDPIFPFDADPTYGDLPPGVCPSKKIKRLLHVPPPGYQVIGVGQPTDADGEPEAADDELPVPMEQGQ